jgi:flagellar FliL protein
MPDEELDDEEELEEDEESDEPKKSKKTLLWVIISIVVLAGSGYGGYSLVSYYQGTPAPEEEEAPAAEENGAESEPETGKKGIQNVKSTMELDAFLVNLADKEAVRFVKATFGLGLDQPNLGTELGEDPVTLAATRDKIISILSTKTADQILTPEGKQKLRGEIRDGVNTILHEGKVVEVFIMDFVVQL